jgi:hypothetical protein
MKTNNFKAEYKTAQLISILSQSLAGKMNTARVRFFGLFICALCKVQTVNFCKRATAFETPAESSSALRRIQRFMAECALESNSIVRLIFKILPHKPPFRLIMDGTSWKFGKTNINVLTPTIAHNGTAFPILISTLGKRGSSRTRERVEIII